MRAREFTRVQQFHRAIVRLDTLQHNRQANACAADLAALFAAPLEESVENSRALFLGNARSRVTELQYETGWSLARTDRNQAPFWRELDRILQQIIDHCSNFVLIRVHNNLIYFELKKNMRGLERESLGLCDRDNLGT